MATTQEEQLEEINTIKVKQMVPIILYVSVLMVTGIVGNTMVCYFYGRKTRRSSNAIFIVTLAVYDLLTCCVNMPTELIDVFWFYTFSNSGACKVLRFINAYVATGSGLTLLVIAYDRYRMICKTASPQMRTKDVKATCLFIGALAMLLSWPALILYGSTSVNLVYTANENITGYDCTVDIQEEYRIYNLIHYGVHAVIFVSSSVGLMALYYIIGKTIYRHRKQLSNTSSPDVENRKYTMIMLAVTAVFILSFLPSLSLKLWIVFVGKHKSDFMSDMEMVLFKFGTNSYLINSVANPIIYGMFNSRFRDFMCTACKCNSRKQATHAHGIGVESSKAFSCTTELDETKA